MINESERRERVRDALFIAMALLSLFVPWLGV